MKQVTGSKEISTDESDKDFGLSVVKKHTNRRARELFRWTPIDFMDTIVDTVESLQQSPP